MFMYLKKLILQIKLLCALVRKKNSRIIHVNLYQSATTAAENKNKDEKGINDWMPVCKKSDD